MAEKVVKKKASEQVKEKDNEKSKEKNQAFVWTDDEVRSLLEVTKEYKTQKESESIDWESVRTKYDDILEKLREKLPESPQRDDGVCLDFLHAKAEVTVKTLAAKF